MISTGCVSLLKPVLLYNTIWNFCKPLFFLKNIEYRKFIVILFYVIWKQYEILQFLMQCLHTFTKRLEIINSFSVACFQCVIPLHTHICVPVIHCFFCVPVLHCLFLLYNCNGDLFIFSFKDRPTELHPLLFKFQI